jgi:hypothetical protein
MGKCLVKTTEECRTQKKLQGPIAALIPSWKESTRMHREIYNLFHFFHNNRGNSNIVTTHAN